MAAPAVPGCTGTGLTEGPRQPGPTDLPPSLGGTRALARLTRDDIRQIPPLRLPRLCTHFRYMETEPVPE